MDPNPYASPRVRTKRALPPRWRMFFVTLAVIGALGTTYLGWSWHRISDRTFSYDRDWPRPWPYPDGWLSDLERWYDRLYPNPPRTIKLHGELDRVRFTILAGLVPSVAILAAGLIPLRGELHRGGRRLYRNLRRRWRASRTS